MVANNLPQQPTPFVGRQSEMDTILRLLSDTNCRLLTLVGPGGIGKTRLALEVGQKIADEWGRNFPNGVYFVPLQPVSAPEFLISSISTAIHFQFYGIYEPRQQLLDYLCGRSLFLILDNFEHLQDGASFLSELLSVAPNLRILVTSRERLNLLEEWAFEVLGLHYPELEAEIGKNGYGAVQLFTQSARRVRVDFALNAENRREIVRICRQVEGMPLALELAAGWIRAFSCTQIADQLEGGLDILETAVRNVPERHRSMRFMLEQSWNLLTRMEQDVFLRLSVFRGGFDYAAAQTVASATLPILGALADKTWLRWDEKRGRYHIHELLRQYGSEKLSADGVKWQNTHDAHCCYFADFLRSQRERLGNEHAIESLHDIKNELENIHLYWDWAITHGKDAEIEAALDSLWLFYDSGSRFHEGEQAFARAVASLRSRNDRSVKHDLLGSVLARQGSLLSSLERYDDALRLLQESIGILREANVTDDLAFALLRMGITVFDIKDYEKSRACFQESFDIYQSLANRRGMGDALFWLGIDWEFREEPEKAIEVLRESLAIFDQLGNVLAAAGAKSQLSQIMHSTGRFPEAILLAQDGLKIYQQAGIMWGIAMSYDRLCLIALSSNDYAAALNYALQSLGIAVKYSLRKSVLLALGRIARLRNFMGQFEQSVELAGFLISHLDNQDRQRYLDLVDELKSKLPQDVLSAALRRGEEYAGDVLVKAILTAAQQGHETEKQSLPVAQTLSEPLTQRELEVLQLLAQGRSNREIGQQIFLSTDTVRWYLKQIYSKLYVHTRTQAVARAHELKLLSSNSDSPR